MEQQFAQFWQDYQVAIYSFLGVSVAALSLAIILMIIVFRRIKRIDLPQDADFVTALQVTPFTVVIILDLLDISLNFLSGPFAWVMLDRLGLKPLRGVAAIEGFLPFTGPIPTMTVAWLYARFAADRIPPELRQQLIQQR